MHRFYVSPSLLFYIVMVFYVHPLETSCQIYAWGDNTWQQVGNGATGGAVTLPTLISPANKWKSVVAGVYHTVAIGQNGTIWAWGDNFGGQLGIGNFVNSNVPVQVGTDADWVTVACGWRHTLAIKEDGSLWAWGDNGMGQLGNGSRVGTSTPVQIGTDEDWMLVSAGVYHSMALKTDGTLWAWGRNNMVQLGIGSWINLVDRPIRVGGDDDWHSVSAGYYFTAAVKKDGSLWVWGANYGIAQNDYSLVPVRLYLDEPAVAVSSGGYHVHVLTRLGALWSWGSNWHGQLGNGTYNHTRVPVRMDNNNDWKAIRAGGLHVIGNRIDRSMYVWGANHYGALGVGNTGNGSAAPVRIMPLLNWEHAAAGYYHSVATVERVPDPPEALCRPATLYLNSVGNALLTATDIDGGSVAEAGIMEMIADATEFDCSHLGDNTVALSVIDLRGRFASCSTQVRVLDAEPPSISVALSPSTLWPPNNKMQDITATVTANDNCGAVNVSLESIQMNEGSTEDISDASVGTYDVDFRLRAKRKGDNTGRVYTVIYKATDPSGNVARASAYVTVPHDVGRISASSTGLEKGVDQHAVSLYPHPIRERFSLTVRSARMGPLRIFLSSLNGMYCGELYEGRINAGSTTVEVVHLSMPPGFYLVHAVVNGVANTIPVVFSK